MDKAQQQQILEHIARHVELSKKEEEYFISQLQYKSFKKNEFIAKQGQISRVQNYILSGGARLFMTHDDGTEHTVQFGIKDWWLADLGSFITQKSADYSIQSFTNTEVLQLSSDNLQKLYKEIPKLERFYRIIIQNAYVSAQKRVVGKTMLPAKERYLAFREKHPQIVQQVPQYMIASYLGITKEFLSKMRGQLRD